nr:hypothetical protein [Tanacetum cinerariifolium]
PESKTPTKEVSEDKIKEMMKLVPIEDVYVQALQVKHPVIDWKVASDDLRDALSVLYLTSAHLRGSVSTRYKGYIGGYVLGIHVKDMVGLCFGNFMYFKPGSL